MNNTGHDHHSSNNHELSYSDEDDDLVFQDNDDDDFEMSYTSTSNNARTHTAHNHPVFRGNDPSISFSLHSVNGHTSAFHYPGTNTYDNALSNYSNNTDNSIAAHTTSYISTSNSTAAYPNVNTKSAATPDQPTEKVRKKPGRKPGPSCPALRKEQNRAAQRAFRDRKERHLHQLENMIKDLKNQHFLVVSAYQREVHQLKAAIESLQSENFYLREVVFAFESALSKGNHVDILKDVKHELFRRHHESRAASASAKASSPAPSTPATTATPATPGTPGTSATPAAAPTTPLSLANHPSPDATTPILSSSTAQSSNTPGLPTSFSENSGGSTMEMVEDHAAQGVAAEGHSTAEGIYSLNGDILYKAPPLFIPEHLDDGKLAAPTMSLAPLSVPRPAYRPPGTNLPKHTEYTKHPTVFDELQSSLFPPGTLESLHINMATPQEVVSDDSLFAEPMQMEDRCSTTGSGNEDGPSPCLIASELEAYKDEDDENEEFVNRVAMTLGIRRESVPKHRLQKEFRVLAKAAPQCDPDIDPKIYQLPHDRRIDYIPCPKLRAQMIVHQNRYSVDELFQVLIDGAICHGPPLRRDSWQLPEAFFERFGFLLGPELERIRNKTWPPKLA
ncbi:hypothetical protein BC939DRAFT_162090 [Gamsiella multidivaricata]|uniref:uncharacterized protein n=1 Tax=Gamsiella multidivaricata TaxID=101098 RepID=UPI002220F06B|nr:uncharacterized protein BC939DRAFT_162090 [Gamsiella multidivaricata]KAG0353543.1 hypothetical protein BGZ54_002206 [Gamsiella multidivaricata]KAI7823642.1 hypothetical protein BC939DRAFT_162090 [Gamsiella multidivaricata]